MLLVQYEKKAAVLESVDSPDLKSGELNKLVWVRVPPAAPMIKTFPYLEIKGTHYEVGRAIGEMFRGKIQETMEDRQKTIQHYRAFRAKSEKYAKLTNDVFPDLMDELKGMADGAQVPLMDLFFHNCPEVYDKDLLIEWDRERAETEEHCTAAVSFNSQGALIGHNEDWAIESLDELYVLKATIGETTFLGLNYATLLAGAAASINNWGLVQCINDLKENAQFGVSKFFFSRAVLEKKTLREAFDLIQKTKSASGQNHFLVQGDDIWDIEVAGNNMDLQQYVRTPYVHTNHCISRHMQEYQFFIPKNSLARYERATELVHDNMTIPEMKALLSDTKNEKYPICRENVTIGSVIIQPNLSAMHICYGKPSVGEFIPYTL